MKFYFIDAKGRTCQPIMAEDVNAALPMVGLKSGEIDFGTLTPEVAIVVFEFGLKLPPDQTNYFSIGGNLYAGNALLYQFDELGSTVDFAKAPPPVLFFRDGEQVEKAIADGYVIRPQMSINGNVVWQWNR